MSKIFSTPKMPSQPVISYIPVPSTNPETDTREQNKTTDDSAVEKERINQILSRHRGRSGTIGTSLRGVLSDAIDTNGQPTRKTLLGD